ncbi:MAG TPA: hypothetical protein VIK24_12020, partial [Pyrinomonadaceae bacterium]
MTQYNWQIACTASANVLSKPTMFNLPLQTDSGQWKIILEKIVAPSPTGCLPRPRLEALLNQSLRSCSATVLSGRAG